MYRYYTSFAAKDKSFAAIPSFPDFAFRAALIYRVETLQNKIWRQIERKFGPHLNHSGSKGGFKA